MNAVLAAAVLAGLVVVGPAPARADIFATFGAVKTIVSTVQQAYGLFDQYVLGNRPPTQLEQIDTLIDAQNSMIVSEVDRLAAAEVKSFCQDAIHKFDGLATDSPAQIIALYDSALHCVTLGTSTLETMSNKPHSQDAMDSIGFSLSVGAPIALVAAVANNQPTTTLKATIIHAWQTLIARMRPTCGFTPDVDVEATTDADVTLHSQGGQNIPIPAHGACYSYQVADPQPIQGSIIHFPTGGEGSGVGNLPWTVTARGNEDFCAGADFCHHATLGLPSMTGYDFSIAVDQSMAATSYPIAQASLNALMPVAEPVAQPVAMASLDTPGTIDQVEVFGVKADGGVVRGLLDNNNGFPDNRNTFEGWQAFPAPRFPVVSISAAVNNHRQVQLFALDRVGHLSTTREINPNDHTQWTPWAEMDLAGTGVNTQFTSVAAVRRESNNFLTLLASTTAGNVVTRTQVLNADSAFNETAIQSAGVGSWTDWQQLPDHGSIVQVTASGKGPQAYAVTKAGTLVSSSRNSDTGVWTNWASFNGPNNGQYPVRAIQAVAPGGGQTTDLLITANSGSVYWLDTNSVGNVHGFQPFPFPGSFSGGLGVVKEGGAGGIGSAQILGVDLNGSVSYASGTFSTFTPWQTLSGGAILRPTPTGPYASPVLSQPQVVSGALSVSWVDRSTNEDTFTVRRVSTAGQVGAVVTTRNTTGKAGTGTTTAITDPAPDPNAPCYIVLAADSTNTFSRASDVRCVNPPTVPNVVGQTQAAATTALTSLGLVVRINSIGTVQTNCSVATNGRVMSTTPAAGTVEEPGTTITVSVCRLTTTTMPNIIGSTYVNALSALSSRRILSGTDTWVYNAAPNGTVISQGIPANTEVVVETTRVDFTVSMGPAPVVVPPADWAEIFNPRISSTECLDVPTGSSSIGLQLQYFHCHGYDSKGAPQRWRFVNIGPGLDRRDTFQIKNVGNNLCLMFADSSGTPGTKLVQGSCSTLSSYPMSLFQILDRGTGHITNGSSVQFELRNARTGLCLAPSNTTGNDRTPATSNICTIGGDAFNTLQFG